MTKNKKTKNEDNDYPESLCCGFLVSPFSELECIKNRSISISLKNVIPQSQLMM